MGSDQPANYQLADEPLPPAPPPRPRYSGHAGHRQPARTRVAARCARVRLQIRRRRKRPVAPHRQRDRRGRLHPLHQYPATSPIPPEYEGVGANVSIPIFNGHLFSARREAAYQRALESDQRLRDQQERISRDVRVAWASANDAYQRIDVTAQFLRQASLALHLAQGRYDLSLASIVELTQAQLNVTPPRSKISTRSTTIKPSTRRSNSPLASSDRRPVFREVQRFPLRRVALALASPPCFVLGLLIWQVLLGHPWGKHPMSNGDVIGWTVFLWLIYFRLITVRLVTEVRPGELLIRMRGLWRLRRVPLDRILSVETITHDIARDYGGYGFRSIRDGKAYVASGSRGVRVTLTGGEKVVVGSQRPDELAQALRTS